MSVLAVLVLAVTVSVWLVRPFGLIADYARFVRLQQGFHPGSPAAPGLGPVARRL
jgi:two-component system sensor histidine kinase CreC